MNIARSSSFRRGLYAGMSSPYRTLFERPTRYAVGPKDLVSLTWQEVGRSVREAFDEEDTRNGEAARATTKRK